ncbi:hypothetical protein T484DRAFT_3628346, partial [Baffinella frigidus]
MLIAQNIVDSLRADNDKLKTDRNEYIKERNTSEGARSEEKMNTDIIRGKMQDLKTVHLAAIDVLKKEHLEAIDALEEEHLVAINALKEAHLIESNRTIESNRIIEADEATHAQEISLLKEQHGKEIDELKAAHGREIADLKEVHGEEMAAAIKELEDGNIEVNAKLRQDHKEEMEKSRVVIQMIRAQSEGAVDKIKALNKQVNDHMETITELRAEIAAVKESSNRLDDNTNLLHAGAITQKDTEIGDLTQKLNTAENTIKGLKIQLIEATTGLTGAVEGSTTLSTEIVQLKSEITDLKLTLNGYLTDTRVPLSVHHVHATLLVAEFQSIMNHV